MSWEKLTAYSNEEHSMTYTLLPHSDDRPMKLPFPSVPQNYQATISLKPVTEQGSTGTIIDYASHFSAESSLVRAVEGAFEQYFTAAFAELRKRFS